MSDQTREQVLRIGREEFDGASADETVRRLIDEHWQTRAVAVVVQYRHADRQGWAEYLAEADDLSSCDPAITDMCTPSSDV